MKYVVAIILDTAYSWLSFAFSHMLVDYSSVFCCCDKHRD